MTAASQGVERPAHIPESAIYSFDMYRDVAVENPHASVERLIQDASPVFWTPHNGGHWMVLSYAAAQEVFRHPEIFSSALVAPEIMEATLAALPPGTPRPPIPTPLMMDPPEHTRYRQPLMRAFSPKMLMALRGSIEDLAIKLIDGVADQGECEFVSAVAEQFPVRVFLEMMGLPKARLAEFRALAHEVFTPRDHNDPAQAFHLMRKIVDALHDDIVARRDHPQQDLISDLWAMSIDGEPMTMELIEDYIVLLFLAGLDTVVIALSFGVYHLAANPDLQQELRAHPDLIGEASEELLRRYSFTVPVRRVVKETELHGQTLQPDDRVILYLPAVDLDPEEFHEPATVDIHRQRKAHMLFGGGPHHCLGSHLARLELQTLYRVLLERLPPFTLAPDNPPTFHVGMNLSLSSLPIRWA
ncbi:cytochrome P450 [Mangrovimicrobium sediminis]|uniref:Cytochrome P450 n=1 Tax=Mangrovimicrobium sediminis TaxID=2562682 RepID=A0A4Z0M9L0_9GAMM|nr:cytochrome P450 [Haliea sp. SAOS-164]TGD76209.1 cytochrome P450 [Haliea sp. SAOS-164]